MMEVTRKDLEAEGWQWLDGMVSSMCDEDPSDIAYSADQMVDAYMAGSAAAHALIHQLGENAAKAAERVAVLEGHLGKLVNFIGRLPAALPTPEEQDAFEAAREVCWEVETRAALTEPSEGADNAEG